MSLEYKVELKKEDEFETLYSWYISEIDQDKNEIKDSLGKWIPWQWSVDFKIKNITHHTSIELENEGKEFTGLVETTKLQESYKSTRSERLFANLKLNEQDYDTELSMFGTNRKIDDITLSVLKGDEEYCYISGHTKNTIEVNFRNLTFPDSIEITLGLKEDDYKDIAERVKDKSINSYFLSLRNVDGFYSLWSPETSTPYIKVLTDEHEINIPENILPDDYELPKLGLVGNFSLTSSFAYELIKEDKIKHDELIELDDIEPTVPLSTSERIQEETKEELSKLLSLIEKQQKYIYWGFLILIFILSLIAGSSM